MKPAPIIITGTVLGLAGLFSFNSSAVKLSLGALPAATAPPGSTAAPTTTTTARRAGGSTPPPTTAGPPTTTTPVAPLAKQPTTTSGSSRSRSRCREPRSQTSRSRRSTTAETLDRRTSTRRRSRCSNNRLWLRRARAFKAFRERATRPPDSSSPFNQLSRSWVCEERDDDGTRLAQDPPSRRAGDGHGRHVRSL